MGKSLSELPPTSSCIHGHLRRCHYVVRLSTNLLIGREIIMDPTRYGWKRIGDVLFANKSFVLIPKEYFITCSCKACTKNCACRTLDVSCTEFCKCNENCKNPF